MRAMWTVRISWLTSAACALAFTFASSGQGLAQSPDCTKWNSDLAVFSVAISPHGVPHCLQTQDEGGHGLTPLHWAVAKNDNPAVITALLDAGANPGARDTNGLLPVDLIWEENALYGTDIYWQLHAAKFDQE